MMFYTVSSDTETYLVVRNRLFITQFKYPNPPLSIRGEKIKSQFQVFEIEHYCGGGGGGQ